MWLLTLVTLNRVKDMSLSFLTFPEFKACLHHCECPALMGD